MKIHLLRAVVFHKDRQTDMMELPVAFRHFANAPKNASTDNIQNAMWDGYSSTSVKLRVFTACVKRWSFHVYHVFVHTFRRNMPPPSSGSLNFTPVSHFRIHLKNKFCQPENGGSTFLRNVEIKTLYYMV